MSKKVNICVIFIVLFSCHVLIYHSLEKKRIAYALSNKMQQIKPVIPPSLARLVSGEFKGVLADLMTIDAFSALGIYLSDPDLKMRDVPFESWQIIDEMLKTSQNLDPFFLDNYQIYQGMFAWHVDVQQTIDFLKVGVDKRFWDYTLPAHIGFDYFYFLGDKLKAIDYFKLTYERSEGNFTYATLSAKFLQQSGKTELAIAYLEDTLKSLRHSGQVRISMEMRLEALRGVFSIEQAVIQYKNRFSSKPPYLHDLIFMGFLREMPNNPYKVPYCFNNEGNIEFDSTDCIVK